MKYTAIFAIVLTSLVCAIGNAALAADSEPQKAILVTGASSGIGLRIAETLAANGFYVYAGARKDADLARLDAMENMSSVRLDVTVQQDIDAAVEFVRNERRGLWGIVNNAGVVMLSPLAEGSFDDVKFTFDVNVFGPIRINQAFLPFIMESKGRTTTIGSISAYIAGAEDGGYSASKFAMEGYTDSLAEELAESGVHVSIVHPGTYKSEIRGKMAAKLRTLEKAGEIELSDEERTAMIDNEFGNADLPEPDEVAETVLHIMSGDSPDRRYMVTPAENQAHLTIRVGLQRLLEMNDGQPYAYDRAELVALLDELLNE
jgi:NAD(P)-dependent dehydrogenase (short-subunit alcohol dehydrogenase family)